MNAIASSRPENAIINARGNSPKKKNNSPEVIMLYVKPLRMFKSMCPDNTFAASLRPNDTFLAKYDINSIKTSKGNKPSGQPLGTKSEKNFNPCLLKPSIVAPRTTVKLNEKVSMKWLVLAKLYGTIPTRLFTNINRNKTYIKGKYI